jgi:DNA-binding transcriptional MerR regulator
MSSSASTPEGAADHRERTATLSIGAFSRASLLSVKALRLYHERGLLVPAAIDQATGYRSYTAAQLADAAVVRRLRDLELPLDDVHTIVSARDSSVTEAVLARHHIVMTERLQRTAAIVHDLQRGLDEPGAHTPVVVREVPAATVLCRQGIANRADYGPFLDDAYGQLFGWLMSLDAIDLVTGPSGATYPGVIEVDETELVVAFVPVDEQRLSALLTGWGAIPAGITVQRWPSQSMACATYVGHYDGIGASYRLLGAWAAEHGAPDVCPATTAHNPVMQDLGSHGMDTHLLDTNVVRPDERVREVYLVSPNERSDPTHWVTELQWPLVTNSPR